MIENWKNVRATKVKIRGKKIFKIERAAQSLKCGGRKVILWREVLVLTDHILFLKRSV